MKQETLDALAAIAGSRALAYDRLASTKMRRTPSGCLEWRGPVNRDGYGVRRRGGRKWLLHRLAYSLAFGVVPEGMCVCHVCDNRLCCEPAHLFIGAHAENIADKTRKGRQAKGARCPHAVLTDAAVRELRASAVAGADFAALGRKFGVSRTAARNAARGRTWRHVA